MGLLLLLWLVAGVLWGCCCGWLPGCYGAVVVVGCRGVMGLLLWLVAGVLWGCCCCCGWLPGCYGAVVVVVGCWGVMGRSLLWLVAGVLCTVFFCFSVVFDSRFFVVV